MHSDREAFESLFNPMLRSGANPLHNHFDNFVVDTNTGVNACNLKFSWMMSELLCVSSNELQRKQKTLTIWDTKSCR